MFFQAICENLRNLWNHRLDEQVVRQLREKHPGSYEAMKQPGCRSQTGPPPPENLPLNTDAIRNIFAVSVLIGVHPWPFSSHLHGERRCTGLLDTPCLIGNNPG
jgi:hypothetical protein